MLLINFGSLSTWKSIHVIYFFISLSFGPSLKQTQKEAQFYNGKLSSNVREHFITLQYNCFIVFFKYRHRRKMEH